MVHEAPIFGGSELVRFHYGTEQQGTMTMEERCSRSSRGRGGSSATSWGPRPTAYTAASVAEKPWSRPSPAEMRPSRPTYATDAVPSQRPVRPRTQAADSEGWTQAVSGRAPRARPQTDADGWTTTTAGRVGRGGRPAVTGRPVATATARPAATATARPLTGRPVVTTTAPIPPAAVPESILAAAAGPAPVVHDPNAGWQTLEEQPVDIDDGWTTLTGRAARRGKW